MYSVASPLHLMCAIARAHTSTRATGLMHVKNNTCQEKKKKASTLTVDHFSLTFVNLG